MTCATSSVLYAVGALTLAILAWRACLCIYRRVIKPPRTPKSYGKWAIVTGSTAGIGREYADYLVKMGMSVMIISRSEGKLKEQVAELKADYSGANVKYIAYDYTDMGPKREAFYRTLDEECAVMDKDGGIALLINNVGIANQYPQLLQELTDKECSDMINCNIDSTIFMSRAVLKYMVPKDKGAIVNVSSVRCPYIT
jgi:17beta-estradiol 17-dehydrogenase / very-long-chain 3-oxoacyl-CoA reductase